MADEPEPTQRQLRSAILGMLQGIMCIQAETLHVIERVSTGRPADVLKAMTDLRAKRSNEGALFNELGALDQFLEILRGKMPDPIA